MQIPKVKINDLEDFLNNNLTPIFFVEVENYVEIEPIRKLFENESSIPKDQIINYVGGDKSYFLTELEKYDYLYIKSNVDDSDIINENTLHNMFIWRDDLGLKKLNLSDIYSDMYEVAEILKKTNIKIPSFKDYMWIMDYYDNDKTGKLFEQSIESHIDLSLFTLIKTNKPGLFYYIDGKKEYINPPENCISVWLGERSREIFNIEPVEHGVDNKSNKKLSVVWGIVDEFINVEKLKFHDEYYA